MDLDIDAVLELTDESFTVRSSAAAVLAMTTPRVDRVVAPSPSLPARMEIAELRDRLRAVAVDVDHLWCEAIDREDFARATRTLEALEASHALHRALFALEDLALASSLR